MPRDPHPPLHDDPALPLEVRRAFAQYGSIDPSAEQRERLFAGLATLRAAPASPVGRWWWLKLVVLGGVLLGLGAVWLRPNEPVHLPAVEVGVTPEKVATPAPVRPPIAPGEPVAPPALADPAHPTKAQVARTFSAKPARTTPPASGPSSVQAELELLVRAKRRLAADPAQALQLTQRHRQSFVAGRFVEEREVIAIEALARLGRASEARARATAFERAHPGSPHLDRIAVVLDTTDARPRR